MRSSRESAGPGSALQTLFGVLIGIAVLYLGRTVLIPIALALLLSFFLSPAMVRLQRWGLGRTFAALLVVGFSFSALVLVCWAGLGQAYNLSLELPTYRDNISSKLRSVTPRALYHWRDTQRVLGDVGGQLEKQGQATSPSQRPIPVEVREAAPAPLEFLEKTAGSILGPLASAFVVLIFVIFILLGREDLRDRVLRLAGSSRLFMTTRALDEAAQRVSRYLLMQVAVNVSYGCLVGFGLLLIGIPHPLVWAVLAALLRFIPYVGPWLAAAGPLLLAIGVAAGWGKFGWTLGLYAILELLTGNVVEPLLYGSSTGISAIAILVAAVFWTWLWGASRLVAFHTFDRVPGGGWALCPPPGILRNTFRRRTRPISSATFLSKNDRFGSGGCRRVDGTISPGAVTGGGVRQCHHSRDQSCGRRSSRGLY